MITGILFQELVPDDTRILVYGSSIARNSGIGTKQRNPAACGLMESVSNISFQRGFGVYSSRGHKANVSIP